jgi:hypothetical protein
MLPRVKVLKKAASRGAPPVFEELTLPLFCQDELTPSSARDLLTHFGSIVHFAPAIRCSVFAAVPAGSSSFSHSVFKLAMEPSRAPTQLLQAPTVHRLSSHIATTRTDLASFTSVRPTDALRAAHARMVLANATAFACSEVRGLLSTTVRCCDSDTRMAVVAVASITWRLCPACSVEGGVHSGSRPRCEGLREQVSVCSSHPANKKQDTYMLSTYRGCRGLSCPPLCAAAQHCCMLVPTIVPRRRLSFGCVLTSTVCAPRIAAPLSCTSCLQHCRNKRCPSLVSCKHCKCIFALAFLTSRPTVRCALHASAWSAAHSKHGFATRLPKRVPHCPYSTLS